MKLQRVLSKITRCLLRARLRPIHVYCFHHVSDVYDPTTMWECDWINIERFKKTITRLMKRVKFISLPEAYDALTTDKFRFKNYAVLTADDGYQSILNILPWLESHEIPITLFINTKYLDKHSWSVINEEQARRTKPDIDMLGDVCPRLYLSKEELFSIRSPFVTIGLHGHEHLDSTILTIDDFRNNIETCLNQISVHPRFIPFFAYPWGRHNLATDCIVREFGLVPVMVNGMKNTNNKNFIDRIVLRND